MDPKLIFLMLAMFFIEEVEKEIDFAVTVSFLYDDVDTIAVEYRNVTTYDYINITKFESNGLVVNGYNYMKMIPFFMHEIHLVNGTTQDYGWLMKYEKKDMVRIFQTDKFILF